MNAHPWLMCTGVDSACESRTSGEQLGSHDKSTETLSNRDLLHNITVLLGLPDTRKGSPEDLKSATGAAASNDMRLIKPVKLTGKQAMAAELLAKGHSYQEIADAMCVKHSTAKSYLRELYNKLGVFHVEEALDKLYRNEWPMTGAQWSVDGEAGVSVSGQWPVEAGCSR